VHRPAIQRHTQVLVGARVDHPQANRAALRLEPSELRAAEDRLLEHDRLAFSGGRAVT
jgi:hypothetical protein